MTQDHCWLCAQFANFLNCTSPIIYCIAIAGFSKFRSLDLIAILPLNEQSSLFSFISYTISFKFYSSFSLLHQSYHTFNFAYIFFFRKTYNGSLRDFFLKVQSNVSSHEENCVSKLIFFLDPHESTLNVMCNTCDFLALIE